MIDQKSDNAIVAEGIITHNYYYTLSVDELRQSYSYCLATGAQSEASPLH